MRLPADVWKIDYEHARRGVWWWWFWLAFIDNPEDPRRPLQLMCLWSTKKERRFRCNGKDIEFDGRIERKGGRAEFDGAVAGWLYDGRRMRENFVLKQARIALDAKKRGLFAEGAWFKEKDSGFEVSVEGKGARLDFIAVPSGKAGAPVERLNAFFRKFTYKITKVSEMRLRGTLELGGSKRKVSGTAYFQKVVVRAPVLPWLWSIVHFKDGSFMSYFCPRVGHGLVGKDVGKLNRNLPFKSKLEFYCAEDGRYREFRPCNISSTHDGRLPAWKITAASRGESFEAELEAYSEASWKIQNGLAGMLKYALHYDEYCVNATRLVFRRKGRRDYTLEQSGAGVGNAEHSWGFLI